MADEGNQNGSGEMDLSLNLGLPQSYLNGVTGLGTTLTISSSPTAEGDSDPMKPPEQEDLYAAANLLINVGSVPVAEEQGYAVDPLVPVEAVPLRSFVIRDVLLVPDDAVPLVAVQPSASDIDASPLTTTRCHDENSQVVRLFFVSDPNFRFERPTETENQPVRQEGSGQASAVKDDDNAEFECNVCFDTAKEPVVTSCGHLFCWSCLYQWLHRNLENKECPTCKGALLGCNITPIYGRGGPERSMRGEVGEEGKQGGFVIPPRPRGSRFEGFNQWFEPVFDVADEDVISSWRSIVEEGMRNMFERIVEPSMKEMFNRCYQTLMETQADQWDPVFGETIGEVLSQRRCPRVPQSNAVVSASTYRREDLLWQWFTLCGLAKTQKLTAMANMEIMFDRITAGMGGITSVGPSAVAGPSSTMAVIQGDSAFASDSPEANSSETSGSLRRTWSSVSGSSYGDDGDDGDDGDVHENIRRRLN